MRGFALSKLQGKHRLGFELQLLKRSPGIAFCRRGAQLACLYRSLAA